SSGRPARRPDRRDRGRRTQLGAPGAAFRNSRRLVSDAFERGHDLRAPQRRPQGGRPGGGRRSSGAGGSQALGHAVRPDEGGRAGEREIDPGPIGGGEGAVEPAGQRAQPGRARVEEAPGRRARRRADEGVERGAARGRAARRLGQREQRRHERGHVGRQPPRNEREGTEGRARGAAEPQREVLASDDERAVADRRRGEGLEGRQGERGERDRDLPAGSEPGGGQRVRDGVAAQRAAGRDHQRRLDLDAVEDRRRVGGDRGERDQRRRRRAAEQSQHAGIERRVMRGVERAPATGGRARSVGERDAAQGGDGVAQRPLAAGRRGGDAVERIGGRRGREGVNRAVEPELPRIERTVGEVGPRRGQRGGRGQRRRKRQGRRHVVRPNGIGRGVVERQGDLDRLAGDDARSGDVDAAVGHHPVAGVRHADRRVGPAGLHGREPGGRSGERVERDRARRRRWLIDVQAGAVRPVVEEDLDRGARRQRARRRRQERRHQHGPRRTGGDHDGHLAGDGLGRRLKKLRLEDEVRRTGPNGGGDMALPVSDGGRRAHDGRLGARVGRGFDDGEGDGLAGGRPSALGEDEGQRRLGVRAELAGPAGLIAAGHHRELGGERELAAAAATARAAPRHQQRRGGAGRRQACGQAVDSFALDRPRRGGQARSPHMPDFTHLHLHTQYSLLDGAIRLDHLFPKVLERGMKSVAITDHGNLFSALDFYQKAKAHGVKPIFGCETYVAPDRLDKTERRSNHLILLAKNEVGWKNLSYLNSMGYLEGFYYNPRIDKPLLRKHAEGLIGLSACLGGEVAQTIMRRGPEAGENAAREFADIFGKENFFLEMQPNGLEEQEQVNGHLQELSKKTGIPLIATNDCHYLNQTDARAHEILMCVQQKKTIHDDKRLHHRNDAFFVKTPAEMEAYFAHIPEALENAARIGALCNVEFKLGETFPPKFQVPDGMSAESYLQSIAEGGLKKRIEEAHRRGEKIDGDAYAARLALELSVIQKMQFAGYFLIVWDFIRHAKEQRIPVGPGRGSGAGSLVAYSMRITDIDPIANKLLFERFLNPERVSMPDFDIDFCMNRRDEVIAYVTDKYGKDNVGQIVTMHQIKARSGVRDIARAMAVPFAEADKVAKFVPEPIQGKSPPIAEAIEKEPRLKALYDESPVYRELLDVAKGLEGLNRHAGKHAAGVVIGDRPLWEYVPCFRPAGDEAGIVTQYDKD